MSVDNRKIASDRVDHRSMPWVYILRCADDSYYVGSARDLESRINQHAIGQAEAYTRRRRPLTLVWAQECENIGDAFELERKIKGWRRDKRLALIEGRYTDLPGLSKAGPHGPSDVTRPEPVEGQDVGPGIAP
jgi:putative endonuclease